MAMETDGIKVTEKALNLRKTKSGQAADKLKPPKYHRELSFLTPYMSDEEARRSSIQDV